MCWVCTEMLRVGKQTMLSTEAVKIDSWNRAVFSQCQGKVQVDIKKRE